MSWFYSLCDKQVHGKGSTYGVLCGLDPNLRFCNAHASTLNRSFYILIYLVVMVLSVLMMNTHHLILGRGCIRQDHPILLKRIWNIAKYIYMQKAFESTKVLSFLVLYDVTYICQYCSNDRVVLVYLCQTGHSVACSKTGPTSWHTRLELDKARLWVLVAWSEGKHFPEVSWYLTFLDSVCKGVQINCFREMLREVFFHIILLPAAESLELLWK